MRLFRHFRSRLFSLFNIPTRDLFLITILSPIFDQPALVPSYDPYDIPEPLYTSAYVDIVAYITVAEAWPPEKKAWQFHDSAASNTTNATNVMELNGMRS